MAKKKVSRKRVEPSPGGSYDFDGTVKRLASAAKALADPQTQRALGEVVEAANALASVQDAVKTVAIQDAAKAVAIQDAAKAVAIQDAAKAVAIQDAVKAVAVQDAVKAVAIQDAVKAVAVQDAVKAVAIQDAVKAVAVQDAVKAVASVVAERVGSEPLTAEAIERVREAVALALEPNPAGKGRE